MKKLSKKLSLAAEFKKWYDKNKAYEYDSTKNDFYYDVLYELLIIQDGLCAYTEYRLIDEKILEKIKKGFVNGKYTLAVKPDLSADLEHFDSDHKKISAWDWSNLFAVYGKVNSKKGTKPVDKILKPDLNDYSPEKFLLYDSSAHMFYANSKLPSEKRIKVNKMILVLGLNHDHIKMKRKDYLSLIKTIEEYKGKQPINQFHTAYSMI